MEIYSYRAIDHQGRIQRGRINALNVADLELRLQRMGLELITYKDLKTQRSLNLLGSSSIKRADLIGFYFHFEQLLEAGVPILEALSDLRDSIENPRLREVTAALIESIQGGKNLSEAMRDFPFVFNTVLVNLIGAGESSSQLPQVLKLIIENLKWQDEQAAYEEAIYLSSLCEYSRARYPVLPDDRSGTGAIEVCQSGGTGIALAYEGFNPGLAGDRGLRVPCLIGAGDRGSLGILKQQEKSRFWIENRRPATEDPGSGTLIKKDDPRPLCQLFCPHVCLRDHGARVSTDR